MPFPQFNGFGDLPEGTHQASCAEVINRFGAGAAQMAQNDDELKVTRERIAYLLDVLARLRMSSRPEELALASGGYRGEVERMQCEVIDYLTQSVSQTTAGAG